MSQEKPSPSQVPPPSAGNTSCSKQEEEDDNGQIVPFVASSAVELIESHKAYYSNCNGDVKYMECLKNHAAAMGGTATDGCGEFMAAGVDGSLEALKCSACQCHRNFHRKVVIKGAEVIGYPWPTGAIAFPTQHKAAKPTPTPTSTPTPYNSNNGSSFSDSDDKDDGQYAAATTTWPPPPEALETKKRFRTKFTPEQKEKMLAFAERAGWKIQKVDSSVVQQFCQEIGVKRRVFKVWMHNNKNTFAKKLTSPSTTMQLH